MNRKVAHYVPLSLIFALLLSACTKTIEPDYNQRTSYYKNVITGVRSDSALTCVTYNIQLGFNANQDPWNKEQSGADMAQIKSIATLLRNLNPDVIALQEVPRNRYNAVIKGFVETLAAELGLNYAFGAHGYNDPFGIYPVTGEWGNAILTKFEIEAIYNHQVEYVDQWERRSLLDATLKINDSTTIHAISLHHLPSPQGMTNTATYIQGLQGEVIVMGDFNHVGEITEFKNIGLTDVDSTYQLHGIDRLFVNKAFFSVFEIGTVPDTLLVSDHWANYARLALKK